jgi:transposase
MKGFVEGEDRTQGVLLPEFLDDYVAEDNPVRVIDVFVDELDLRALGFEGVDPEATGRPASNPATTLKIYVYGYINQIQASRRLERETVRNVEMMWLTGRLTTDFKTIADFRKDSGPPSLSIPTDGGTQDAQGYFFQNGRRLDAQRVALPTGRPIGKSPDHHYGARLFSR